MFIKVVVFDDNEYLLDSIKLWLVEAEDIRLTGLFTTCDSLEKHIQRTEPDVVIMDIDMPGTNGIEATRIIHANFPAIQVLVHTVFDNDEKVFAALEAGACGYILKNAEPQNLLQSIREVASGGVPMTPSIARKVLRKFQTRPVMQNSEEYNLTKREKEVLALLVAGKAYKMISDELGISYDTVRAHIKKIYEKLHVSSMTEAVVKALNKRLLEY